jgi:hypothetical protein
MKQCLFWAERFQNEAAWLDGNPLKWVISINLRKLCEYFAVRGFQSAQPGELDNLPSAQSHFK